MRARPARMEAEKAEAKAESQRDRECRKRIRAGANALSTLRSRWLSALASAFSTSILAGLRLRAPHSHGSLPSSSSPYPKSFFFAAGCRTCLKSASAAMALCFSLRACSAWLTSTSAQRASIGVMFCWPPSPASSTATPGARSAASEPQRLRMPPSTRSGDHGCVNRALGQDLAAAPARLAGATDAGAPSGYRSNTPARRACCGPPRKILPVKESRGNANKRFPRDFYNNIKCCFYAFSRA